MSPILIYSFVSLKIVAYYGNYTLLIDKVNLLLNNLFGSVGAGIGNLIAEGNKEKIEKVFWQLLSLRFLIIGIAVFGFYKLMPPFITLWLGAEYVLPNSILILLIINFFISLNRSATDNFLFGSGLFYDTWAPITEAIIYLFVSIIGGYYWGLFGVILGNTVSMFLIIGLWKPYFLFSKGFKKSVFYYWKGWCHYTILLIASILFSDLVIKKIISFNINNWTHFLIYSIIAISFFSFIYFFILYTTSQALRDALKRIINKNKYDS